MNTLCARLATGILGSLSVGLLFPILAVAESGTSVELDSLSQDVEILAGWFEGEFDNVRQVRLEAPILASIPELDRHKRMHVTHTRLSLPQFGKYVFYVEEYLHDDPSHPTRVRFVTFEVDRQAKAIRMKQGLFHDEKKYIGGGQDISKFSDLERKDIFYMDEVIAGNQCDVFWKRQAGQFQGSMPEKGCGHFVKKYGGQDVNRNIYYVHDMYLSENDYWRVDTGHFTDDNERLIGSRRDDPYRMARAHRFTCGGYYGQGGVQSPDSGAVTSLPSFTIHSEGGSAVVNLKDGEKALAVGLESRTHGLGSGRAAVRYLSSEVRGDERSMNYSAHDEDARILGAFNSAAGAWIWCER